MALEDLLDQAHQALLTGDLAALDRIGARLESLAAPPMAPDRATADRLRAKAERNARLLQAAGRGVKAALGRLAEIAEGPTMTTYDSRGQKAAFCPVPSAAFRRL